MRESVAFQVVALVYLLTLAVSFSFYSVVVMVYEDGFHFNVNGLMVTSN